MTTLRWGKKEKETGHKWDYRLADCSKAMSRDRQALIAAIQRLATQSISHGRRRDHLISKGAA